MSYINDALHKAQKEKETPYALYGDVILPAEKERRARPRRRAWLLGLLIILSSATGLALWRYDFNSQTSPAKTELVKGPDVLAKEVAAPVLPVVDQKPAAEQTSLAEQKPQSLRQEKEVQTTATKLPKPEVLDVESLFAQALQKQREGKLPEAKKLYKQVIRARPQHYQALNNLGVVYLNLKTDKWAIARLEDAIRVKPNYAEAHYNLACLYAQKNDTRQSLVYLKKAAHFNPQIRQWASKDSDLKNLANLPEFKNILQAEN